VLVANDEEAEDALNSDRCGAYSADLSWLAAARAGFRDGVARDDILPTLISKEPLAPIVRAEDDDLLDVIRWTIYALIEAEELGLTAHGVAGVIAGIDSAPTTAQVRHLLEVRPPVDVAASPGNWVCLLIAAVGNYGEIFDRNLGKGSAVRIERGLNRQWTEGGLLYAPPLGR
jgi:general L-amino acid transport system substrate-binding protein